MTSTAGTQGGMSSEASAGVGRLWKWLRWLLGRKPQLSTAYPQLGLAALKLARAELHKGACEQPPGSNSGPYVECYWLEQGKPRGAWCAIFASFCFIRAAAEYGRLLKLELSERRGAKKLAKTLVKHHGGQWVDHPIPGDLAIFHRGRQVNGQWTWRGHVAIVDSIFEDPEKYATIGGNEKNRVRGRMRYTTDPKLLGFVRL